ncbi:hypothetical protein GBAR_LOCUS16334 [Geodia barretti]|uniref:Uncharacterized protein n=1 Tax=Geodia barretti TaxID=519541 RepID=A0AA35WW28_GEOBA|nr:hypothetical protein GBAR_LOCUS16334 [Geodia barretti]
MSLPVCYYSPVMWMWAVFLPLLLDSSLAQVFSSEGEANECRLDDLHWNYLQPQGRDGVLTINKGACSRRSGDESYGLDSGNTPGISVPFNELSNRLNRSWCVSIVANTQTGNLAPLVTFYHNNLTEIGSIVLTQTLVNITVRGSSASFNFPRQQEQFEHVRLQLCAEENTLYFYYGCEPMGSQSFTNTGFSDSDVVGLLRDLTDNTIRGYMLQRAQCHQRRCGKPPMHIQSTKLLAEHFSPFSSSLKVREGTGGTTRSYFNSGPEGSYCYYHHTSAKFYAVQGTTE